MPKNKNIRKLTKVAGHSFGVVIPPDFLRAFGWRERQRLIVKKVARGVLIIDAKTKKRKK